MIQRRVTVLCIVMEFGTSEVLARDIELVCNIQGAATRLSAKNESLPLVSS